MGLDQYDDMYHGAEAKKGKAPVPEGTYQVICNACRVDKTQKGDDCLKWEFEVISGSYVGRKIFKTSFFTLQAMPYLKGELELCGIVLERFSDLPANTPTVIDETFEVTVKKSGEYTNIYINKPIKVARPKESYVPPLPEDDIPF